MRQCMDSKRKAKKESKGSKHAWESADTSDRLTKPMVRGSYHRIWYIMRRSPIVAGIHSHHHRQQFQILVPFLFHFLFLSYSANFTHEPRAVTMKLCKSKGRPNTPPRSCIVVTDAQVTQNMIFSVRYIKYKHYTNHHYTKYDI